VRPGLALRAALLEAPLRSCLRVFVRAVDHEYSLDPVSGLGANYRAGRYHVVGSGRVLYLASSMRTLERERGLAVARREEGNVTFGFGPTTIVAVRVRLHKSLLDLCDPLVQRLLGTTHQELVSGLIPSSIAGIRAPTQRLGMEAIASGRIHALRAPSARLAAGRNLVVFLDRLGAEESLSVLTRPVRWLE
jgi:RES domain-containing protein